MCIEVFVVHKAQGVSTFMREPSKYFYESRGVSTFMREPRSTFMREILKLILKYLDR